MRFETSRAAVGVVLLVLCMASANAAFLQLIDPEVSVESNKVKVTVRDVEEGTTHTWTSPQYTLVASVTAGGGGLVAWFEKNSGVTRLHAVAYDPGNRKWIPYDGDSSSGFSNLSINCGVVAAINSSGQVVAVAYDPGSRSWKLWRSFVFNTVQTFSNADGVVACLGSMNQYATAAAYDMGDHDWHDFLSGPANYNLINITNSNAVVQFLSAGKIVAKAYDPSEGDWVGWTQTSGGSSGLQRDGSIIGYTYSTSVNGLVYDWGGGEWVAYTKVLAGIPSYFGVSGGYLNWVYKNVSYNYLMAPRPKARMIALKPGCEDSMRFQFIDNASGNIDSWSWDFGDGSTSSDRSPMHSYKKPGDYIVKFKVTGPGGNHTSTKTITVPVPTYTLTYKAGSHGSITGTATQKVALGKSGTAVKAVGTKPYYFVKWSDGSKVNPRTDANVTRNITVTASFSSWTSCESWELYR